MLFFYCKKYIKSRIRLAIYTLIAAFVLLCFDVGFCSDSRNNPKVADSSQPWSGKVLRVQLHDKPGIEFLGIFVAKELGLFAKQGLAEVAISWETHYRFATDFLLENQADIATGWMSEAVLARARGENVVVIAAITQHPSSCILVRNDALGKSHLQLSSLNGQKVGIWFHHETQPQIFMAINNIRPRFVVHHSYSDALFSERAVVGTFSTTYSVSFMTKYLAFRDSVRVFRFSDYGCDIPENSILCSEEFLQSHPDACHKFVKAIFLGWSKVFEDEESALRIYSKYCRMADTLDDPFIARQQLAAWKAVLDLSPELERNGQCKKEKYARLVLGLKKLGKIPHEKIPSFETIFWPVLDGATMKRLSMLRHCTPATKNAKPKGPHE